MSSLQIFTASGNSMHEFYLTGNVHSFALDRTFCYLLAQQIALALVIGTFNFSQHQEDRIMPSALTPMNGYLRLTTRPQLSNFTFECSRKKPSKKSLTASTSYWQPYAVAVLTNL